MECPYCEEELVCTDYYGTGAPFGREFKKGGDIYECQNEECDKYQESFHTDLQDNLYEGYPC